MFRALVVGHICLDLTPDFFGPPSVTPGSLIEVGPLAMRAGGSVSNTGRDLLALGARPRLLADIGDDHLGGTLRALLAAEGLDADLEVRAGAATSYSVVVRAPGHDRMFWHHVGANAGFDGSSIRPAEIDLLHVGYPAMLPALLGDQATGLLALLRRTRDAGVTTSVDLSVVDPASAAALVDWPLLLTRIAPSLDVLSPSADDLRSMRVPVGAGLAGLADAADALVRAGVGVVLLTAGVEGMFLRTAGADRLRASRVLAPLAAGWADQSIGIPSASVEPGSTTGAGDAATAGLLFGLLTGMAPAATVELAAACGRHRVGNSGPLPGLYGPTTQHENVG